MNLQPNLQQVETQTSPKVVAQQRESIAQALALALDNQALLRSSARATLTCDVDFSSESNFYSGFSTDLSEGGLFLATMGLLPVGSQVEVSFTIPGGATVNAVGEVRWLRAFNERSPNMFPGMGIKFVGLDAAARTMIDDFVAQREPMFFPE